MFEELWASKDELAREAGYDVHRFFDNLRRWSEEREHAGVIVRNAEELRRLSQESQSHQVQTSTFVIKEDASKPAGSDQGQV